MEHLAAYVPIDRYRALARRETLPTRAQGAVLYADISGFTPLTEALVRELGPRRGADLLTHHLNQVYEALIAEIHRYDGSVIGFSGDAITCWFDEREEGGRQKAEKPVGGLYLASLRATLAAAALQEAMARLGQIVTPGGATIALAIKVAVTSGPVRRFLVGDPAIQYLDVMAGATMQRLAQIEQQAQKGEILLGAETISQLNGEVELLEWRGEAESEALCAVINNDQWSIINYQSSIANDQLSMINEQFLSKHTFEIPNPPSSIFHPPFPSAADLRPWLLPPIRERLLSGQGQFLAEVRPAVALFLRFDGLDYDQDEAAGEKLDAFIRWVQQVLASYDGALIQLTIGEKGNFLYAAFGAPITHTDNASRAVAAALTLHSPPAGLSFIHSLKIGLSQGRMRAGAYGSASRCTYGVLGDEVNVAARLMQKAELDQILASQHVFEAAAKTHRFKFLGQVQLKGKQNLLPIYLLLDQQPAPGRSFRTPLVGRETELEQAGAALNATQQGAGRLVRLEGVAGIGKSHLADALAQQAREQGWRVVNGACHSTSQGTPYFPWRQMFRALFDFSDERGPSESQSDLTARQIAQLEQQLGQANPVWPLRLPLLGDLLGLAIPDNSTTAAFEAKLRQEALFTLAVELLQQWATAQPLLLVLEDVHWLDEASQKLLLALSRAISGIPLAVLLTHRPGDSSLWPELEQHVPLLHLPLAELPSQGITTLLANNLGGQPSMLLAALVEAYAQGNPFFSEELLDTLRELDYLRRDEAGRWELAEPLIQRLRAAHCLTLDRSPNEWRLLPAAPLSAVDLNIPDSIHGLVLARLDRLPEPAKLTLKVASAIGQSFELELLAQAHPGRPTPAALREQLYSLAARDLVYPTPAPAAGQGESPLSKARRGWGTYDFKHNIIQEVAYQTLLASQQQGLHQAVGQSLEAWQPEAVERLAYHYLHSGLRDKTLHYLDQAARKSQRDYANETALNYYHQALALEERWEWRKGQVEILHLLGQRAEEREALDALEVSLSNTSSRAGVQRSGGEIPPTPLHPSSPAEFETAYLWGQYYEAISEYAQAQAAITRALEASREIGDLAGEVRCLAQLGLVAFQKGDYEQAYVWYSKALALFQLETTYPDDVMRAFIEAYNNLGLVHREQGEYDHAETCYQQALNLIYHSGDRRGEANTLFGLGASAMYQRSFAKAQFYYQQALNIQRVIGDRTGEGTTLFNLASAFTDAGDYGQAEPYLVEALRILQTTDNRWQQLYVLNNMGILYLTLGDLFKAQSYLEEGIQLASEIDAEESRAYLLVNLGLVMQFQGDLTAAEQLLTEGLTLAQTMNNKRLEAFYLSYLSAVHFGAGQLGLAIDCAQVALLLRTELNLRLYTTFDLTSLAAIYLAMNEIPQALGYTEQGLSILEEYGGEGPEFPERDYWISYQVLVAAGQTERAKTVLQSAYALVMRRAERITDLALRQSFLERVEVNREIVAAYRRQLDN
jgi:class 3 adenylate cyclase/tetratricopeptide (TPR) repeat protein